MQIQKSGFETYNQLVEETVANPTRWYPVTLYETPVAGKEFSIFMNQLEFKLTLSEDEIQNLYVFPKGESVVRQVYGHRHEWVWRVQLCVIDGELRVGRLRALPQLPSKLIDSNDYQKREAVSAAIAAEAPNGTYILRVRNNKHITSKKNGQRYLLLEIEVLDKQARGYIGALFFDETNPYAMDRLHQIERALGIQHDLWQKMEDARNDFLSKEQKHLEWRYLKARLDFSGDYLRVENPRAVDKQEVQEWL